MNTVTSRDGTAIAFTRDGDGPGVILIGGGLDDGSENTPLVPLLAEHFTVVNYSRRGRGASGDTPPYDLQREIEDLAALIAEVNADACHLYGVSSGGALALEAAAAGLPVRRLAVYEVPYQVDEEAISRWTEYVADLAAARDRPDDMIELFMRLAGSGNDDIAEAKRSPVWSHLTPMAHTLTYDAACLGAGPPPVHTLAAIAQPVLVITGALHDPHMQGLQPGFFDDAANLMVQRLPHAERRVLENQSHVADPNVMAPVLQKFFGS